MTLQVVNFFISMESIKRISVARQTLKFLYMYIEYLPTIGKNTIFVLRVIFCPKGMIEIEYWDMNYYH